MRYTTTLPPIGEVPEPAQPEALHPIQTVRPVRARTFPAHIAEHYSPSDNPPTEKEERRSGKDRRGLCRRLAEGETLLETRSSVERRKRSRRQGDPATAVDEEI